MERLKLYYREKIQEVLKSCSKKAADALSAMTQGQDVIPFMTSINLKPMDDLFRLPEDNIVTISDMDGDLAGTMIVSFKGDAGLKIINMIMGRDPNLICDLGEEEVGVLKEYMSTVGGTFLTEFGNAFGFTVLPQPPNFEGKFKEVAGTIEEQLKALNNRILFINSSMTVVSLNSDAIFYILFDENSLNLILNEISKGDDNPFEQEL